MAHRDALDGYLSSLQVHRKDIGAIVMNCNPFTLGHRYLIEYSACKVEHLYIFVVEEDKSIFPFADRIELVRQGTADLPNVTVLPSGKFIISSLTFVDYFNKSEIQDRTIDPSQDVTLFATEIAPALGINIRFAGEEPLDLITKQYNDAMARILPQHGIEFEAIPRKENNGEVISASRVRALLEKRDFDQIEKLVPITTLKYLKTNTVLPIGGC
jgi:[citrate (pro-3S)-lyase] ligase